MLFIAGSAGDAAGGALTLTGVGAVIGVPLDVVSTTAVVAGGTAAVGFAVKGGQELATMNSMAQDAANNQVEQNNGGRPEGAAGASSGPQPSPNLIEPTNPPQYPPSEGELPPGHSVRAMGPTGQYPDGYWIQTNAGGQPVDSVNW